MIPNKSFSAQLTWIAQEKFFEIEFQKTNYRKLGRGVVTKLLEPQDKINLLFSKLILRTETAFKHRRTHLRCNNFLQSTLRNSGESYEMLEQESVCELVHWFDSLNKLRLGLISLRSIHIYAAISL